MFGQFATPLEPEQAERHNVNWTMGENGETSSFVLRHSFVIRHSSFVIA
jgi:hypothetical protein